MSFLKSAQGHLFLKHSFFLKKYCLIYVHIYIYIVYTHVEFFIRSSLGNSSEGFVTALSE